MGKKAYIGVGNIAQRTKKIYVGVNGAARKVKKAYVGVNGIARIAYSGEVTKPVFSTYNVSNCGGLISNAYLYNGFLWFFSYTDKALYGIDTQTGDVKKIAITSDATMWNRLYSPAVYPITISVANGNLFLAQSHWTGGNTSVANILRKDNFTGNESNILLVNAYSYSPSSYASVDTGYSEVTFSGGEYHIILGIGRTAASNIYTRSIFGYRFTENTSAAYQEIPATIQSLTSIRSVNECFPAPLPSYSKLNHHELITTSVTEDGTSKSHIKITSYPNGDYSSDYGESQQYFGEDNKYRAKVPCVPIRGNNVMFVGYGYSDSGIRLWFASNTTGVTIPVDLTSDNSSVPVEAFDDNFESNRAQAYISAYNLWIFASNRGLVITQNPLNTEDYYYVDVSEDFVDISRFRTVEYESGSNTIYIVGENQDGGTVRALSIDVSTWDFN